MSQPSTAGETAAATAPNSAGAASAVTALEQGISDISYYIDSQQLEKLHNLDVPLSNGEIVQINLINDLPEDHTDLIGFLQSERCGKQYWITVASAYARLNKLVEAQGIIEAGLKLDYFQEEDLKSFHSFLIWLYFKFVSIGGVDKEHYLNQASMEINQLGQRIKLDSSTSTANSTSNILSQAVLLLFQGQDDDALDIFEKILRIDGNNCFAILGKAQIILNKTKNYQLALKLYQQVLILNPLMKPDPRLGIGLCFWFLKDDKMALTSWERCLELDPTNLNAKVLINLAKFHLTFNNSLSDEEFLTNYKTCLIETSKLNTSSGVNATILLPLVSYYFAKEDYTVVEQIIKKIVYNIVGDDTLTKFNNFTRKKFSKYHNNVLSQCCTWLGRIEFVNKSDFLQASKYFQEAIKLNDGNIVAKLGLGQAQYNRGSVEEAIMTFESILRSNSKCLEVNYSLGILYSQQANKQELAIQILERYIRLSNNRGLTSKQEKQDGNEFLLLNKEPINLNAYLTLSKLYESSGDINQSLNYLNKAIESRKNIGKSVPLEIYNNIGVFNFMKQNYQEASENFQIALEQLDGNLPETLTNDLKVSLTFNLARSKEVSNRQEALTIYETLLNECPNYFSAKLRILFLNCIAEEDVSKEEIKTELETLMNSYASNLEIRSFYGWFIKNFGKKLGLANDADTKHQKDTLVEYDSHDCYALISLGNIYCIMARDSKEQDKRKKYYIRAIELFTKVLSVDPKNVYAAQGLAITLIENKETNKGLDILRKIRDSLNDISVYLNLGHVLAELKQYGKAIENYELALGRFTDGKDSKIILYLGRTWYLRGHVENNLSYYRRSLEYTKLSYEYVKGTKSSIKFNIAYLQFQIAEFITKQSIQHRKIEDIEQAISGLKEGIELLNELSSADEKHPPYPKQELKARANLGTSTLLNRLNVVLEETKSSIAEVDEKLQVAKKLRQEEEEIKLQQEQQRLLELKEKEEKLAQERAVLQEQAQQWAEEARMNVEVDEENHDELFDKEVAEGEKKRKGKSIKGGDKKKQKKKRAKKNIVDSEEEEEEPSQSESEPEQPEAEDATNGETKGKKGKSKKNFKSNEFINDSDELEDDLFGDEEEEAKLSEEEQD
ncbi:RNA polymerase-associated protein [Spathaspora sp. JA1]|nr:RNA polymerase-associated protein [Spathaspora sp. JA1]